MACIEVINQRAQLSAADVDARLRRAISEMHNAERSVFLWFCEIEGRSLYRELGYGSMHAYAHTQKDEATGTAVVQTQKGPKKLSRAELAAAECDAVITEPGKRNRSTIPPSVRQAVLVRDQHHCRAPAGRHQRSAKPRDALRRLPPAVTRKGIGQNG